MTMVARRNVHRLYHININCSDLDLSLAFYQKLGFQVVKELGTLDNVAGLGRVLGLPEGCRGRAALLGLAGQPQAPMLDLVEWHAPRVPKGSAINLATPGFGRICLKVDDCDALHAELVAAGHSPYSLPTRLDLAGSDIKVFCVEDPDGVVVEFMEFLPQSRSIAHGGPDG